MENPFLVFNSNLLTFANGNKFFYISVCMFLCEFIFGCLYLWWLSSFEKLKYKRTAWLYYFYQTIFFFDVWLCLSDALYNSNILTSLPIALLFALVKFMLLIALYGLICAHKAILLLSEKDKLKNQESVKSYQITPLNHAKGEVIEQARSIDILNQVAFDSEKADLADINVCYLLSLIERLKTKNITEEERERLNELQNSLKTPILKGDKRLRDINENLEYLVKKVAEYGVVV